jgi:predicted DNA-binding protein YlxM (UPF0122 family)
MKQNKMIVLEANSKQATIKIDGITFSNNWTIMPEIKPDIFPVEIEKGKSSTVSFYTDLDSISYTLGWGDSKEFVVLLNKKDSAFTRFEGVSPKVIFTDKYIQENKGKWSVEVMEAQELLQVIFAITPTGLADVRSMIINHDTTNYYLEVLKEFRHFKDEPIVAIMDSLIQKNWYINLKADACALEFNEENQLTKSSVYDRMRGAQNLLEPYLDHLNDFSEKSNFRTFFRKNQFLYDSLIAWHERAIPTKKQWDWLEAQFPDHKYDNYRITFSPLVKGNHSTVRFNNNGFKQAIMFIAPPYRIKNVNEKVSEGLVTRIVFTEIDHNYVNPETDKYLEKINEYFGDRNMWTSGKESKGYTSPYTIFNEYMTWSVYLLYCYDQYESENFEVINKRIVSYIINRRGFHRFDDFHNTLLKLYSERETGTTIADLYGPLLLWAANYNPK